MESIFALLKRLDSMQQPSMTLLRTVMKALRKSKIRRPDIVATYGPKMIKSGGFRSAELLAYYENIFLAALDHGDYELADKNLKLLVKQFPNSNRVKRLVGMMMECEGNYEGALAMYEDLLKDTPSNLLVMKRKVAVYRAQGNMKAAVVALHEILKLYQADSSSWMELADIHLFLCDYQSAAYCFEELILLAPLNSLMHIRLADALYTIGGMEALVKARKHYSISLANQSHKTNTRALYGMVMACRALLQLPSKKFSPNEESVTKELLAWAMEKLHERSSANTAMAGVSRGIAQAATATSSLVESS